MKDIRKYIKNVLVEENQNKKVNLVKRMIYEIFDEVIHIEQSTYDGKPLLTIYFTSDSKAANITSWFTFTEHISDEIKEITGGNIVVCPSWAFHWDPRIKNADVFITTKLLKYDEEGNVINESKENKNKKVNLVKQMIYDLFDDVSFIEESIYDKRPLLRIYFDSDDRAANIESWLDNKISEEISEMTNDNIIVCPYWKPDWDWKQKEADIFIDSRLLKYDNLGNVINESKENKKIEKPIKFFYENFLNEEPIEYKGIILQPTYNEEYDVITWEIENPEDYSFNGELLKELATNEFRDFCSLTGLDFFKLVKKANVFTNMPNGRCHLNKKDNDFIENNLKNKKSIEFSVHDYEFYLNFNYRRNEIKIHSDMISFYTYGDVDGFKVDVKTKEKTKIDRYFIQQFNIRQYEDFRNWQIDDFYFEIREYLRQNPRFYESGVDMFDAQLELRYKPSI